MVILGGIFAPAYQLWKQKTGVEPDANTPEGMEYWKQKYGIKERNTGRKAKSSFFSRSLQEKQSAAADDE
jgi:hypothetical protein